MNILQLTRRFVPVFPAKQSLLQLQSDANKASSKSFAQHLYSQLSLSAPPAYGVASQSSVTSQNSVAATNANTPESLAAQLLAANRPPASQSLEPVNAPLYSGAYIKEVNYNGFINQANLQNQNAAAKYQLDMSNWALNERQREALGLASQPPPAAPQYVGVNGGGFDEWWASLANFGEPAPVTFITPISNQQQSATTNTKPELS